MTLFNHLRYTKQNLLILFRPKQGTTNESI